MVADKIDMSLDDIIASNRKSSRGGRGGRGGRGRGGFRGGRGGGQRGGSNNFRSGGGGGPMRRGRGGNTRSSPYSRPKNLPDRWEHDKYEGQGAGRSTNNGRAQARLEGGGMTTGTHLQITNLDFGVTESDIKELFSEFGKLKKAIINYDESGRSHGTADVIFERKPDAVKAFNTYNGVPLDGRPMKIEVVTPQVPSYQSPSSSNGNGTPARRRFSGGSSRGSSRGRSSNGFRGGRGGGGRGGRGRGGNRGGRRGDRGDVPSKDDLDKELDSYAVKGGL